ncbi:MAG: GNAT family N-acetyltransferase [Cyanophyceae cyanobacterium]
MTNHTIVRLKRSQLHQAVAVLSNTFDSDPIFRYFLAQTDGRPHNSLKQLCKTFVQYTQPYRYVYTTNDLKGVAAWLPPGQFPFHPLQLLQAGMYALPLMVRWSKLQQLISFFLQLEDYHKQDVAQQHWYLALLGVAQEYQNQGIGGLLIQPILEKAERERLCCYLEATTQSSVRFYQKHGFAVVRTVELSGNNLRVWTMKRAPSSS